MLLAPERNADWELGFRAGLVDAAKELYLAVEQIGRRDLLAPLRVPDLEVVLAGTVRWRVARGDYWLPVRLAVQYWEAVGGRWVARHWGTPEVAAVDTAGVLVQAGIEPRAAERAQRRLCALARRVERAARARERESAELLRQGSPVVRLAARRWLEVICQ